MFGLGPFELAVIGIIAVLLFGGNLPEVARKFGGSYRDLRRSLNEVQQEFRMAEYETKKVFKEADATLRDATADTPDDDEDDDTPPPSVPKFKPPSA